MLELQQARLYSLAPRAMVPPLLSSVKLPPERPAAVLLSTISG